MNLDLDHIQRRRGDEVVVDVKLKLILAGFFQLERRRVEPHLDGLRRDVVARARAASCVPARRIRLPTRTSLLPKIMTLFAWFKQSVSTVRPKGADRQWEEDPPM